MSTLSLLTKRFHLLVYFLFVIPSIACGAQTISSITANPQHIQVNTPTQVLFNSVISDPTFIQGSSNLQRRGADGKWTILGVLHDDGLNGDVTPGDGTFSLLTNFDNPEMGNIHLRVSAAFKGLLKRVFSDELDIPVGVLI